MLNSKSHLSLEIQTQLPPISPPCRSPIEANMLPVNYTKFTEMLRKGTNSHLQCSMFCGGRKCKYESSANWSEEEKAFPALYSHWVTDNILAMARPSNQIIHQFKLIDFFKKNGIKTIINLQEPGEHASCGPPLDQSGFSYDPKLFMDYQIYFYNFQWKDYSGASEGALLDMVKVVTFALSQGKIAIHCHAGLGRTGALIASYLIFTYRCHAHSAIKFVRKRRPNSIQSRSQILSLFKFANHISPCFIVYKTVSSKSIVTTLNDFLRRQRVLLHGEELRCLRYIPKVLFIICEKLIKIGGKESIMKCSHDIDSETEENITGSNFTRNYISNLNKRSKSNRKQFSKNQTNILVEKQMDTSDNENDDKNDLEETNSNDLDSISSEYSLQYEVEVDSDKNDFEIEDDLLIDSLANTEQVQQTVRLSTNSEQFLTQETLAKHRPSFEILQNSLLKNNGERTTSSEVIIAVMIGEQKTDAVFDATIYNFQKTINNNPTGWEKLCEEYDLEILTALFWNWFENLDIPIFNNGTISKIVECKQENMAHNFFAFDPETRYTLEYLVRFVMRLCSNERQPLEEGQYQLMARLVAALTIKRVQLPKGESIPKQKANWLCLSARNREALFSLISTLIQLINDDCGAQPPIH